MKYLYSFIGVIISAVLSISTAQAHSMHAVAQLEGNEISGQAYYSDMSAASDTFIAAYIKGQEDNEITSKTDKDGFFKLQVPAKGNYNLIVEGDEGHKVEIEVPIIEGNKGGDSSSYIQIRQDIDQLKNKIYLQNILGGIGYIVGVFGLIAFFRAREMTKRANH